MELVIWYKFYMPVFTWKCPNCENIEKTLKKQDAAPECTKCDKRAEMEKMLIAPNIKCVETVNSHKGTKRQKNLTKILKERARNFARDKEGDELIQKNKINELASSNLLNKEGKRRRKIDDI